MSAPDLDQLIARARATGVRPDDAHRYVAELGRWARTAPTPRRAWVPWLGGGLAVAAAAALVLVLVLPRGGSRDGEAVWLGERVALIASDGAGYRVRVADAERTEVAIERGTVTARLWPGGHAHRLAMDGGGALAVASGTVFSLTVDAGGATVEVHEGTVAVTRGGERHEVGAGATWPPRAVVRGGGAARALLALAARPPGVGEAVPPPVPDAALEVTGSGAQAPDASLEDASPEVAEVAMVDAGASPRSPGEPRPPGSGADAAVASGTPDAAGSPAADAAAAPALADRWRQARLLRGQGELDAAVRECLAIADAKDPTWSPIALLEAARIELGPRASPERAISLCERFEAEWRAHGLAPEARELRCRALRQLDRGAECSPP